MVAHEALRAPWRSRIVGEEDEDPTQLLASPLNARIHPQTQEQALIGMLDQVGWVQRVIVSKRTGHVLDGHLRVAAAISRGEPAVPVLYVDVDDAEEKLILATMDPLSAMAGYDAEVLDQLLEHAQTDSAPLQSLLDDLAAAHIADARHLPLGTPPPEPQERSQRFIELYCSVADLMVFQATLDRWAELPGVTVNIS